MRLPWNRALVDQLDFQWSNFFRPRLDALTDDVYLWEPVPGCWSIRRSDDGGRNTLDDQYPPPDPNPVTTIAWRMAHIASGVFGERAINHFGAHAPDGGFDWPITAAGGRTMLDHWYAMWTMGVRSLGEDGLGRPCGPAEGPYADEPLATLVLHINREALHHAAEILLLIDLFEHAGGRALV